MRTVGVQATVDAMLFCEIKLMTRKYSAEIFTMINKVCMKHLTKF